MGELVDTRVEAGDTEAARPLAASASSASLVWLAAFAVLLVIGYYVLSVVLVVVLLVAAFLAMHLGLGGAIVGMFAFAGAIAILVSILPRFDRYKPAGVRITPESEPKLFEAISQMARKTGQRMPYVVYVMPQFNAWVNERGGFIGMGRRRYPAVGFPLAKGDKV